MPPRTSSRARTSVRSRKPSGKITQEHDSQVTPPTSPIASVPPTPRATRISPRKRELPAEAPAVQMDAPPPTSVVSRRLSFGTIDSGEDADATTTTHTPAPDEVKAPLNPSPQKASARKVVPSDAGKGEQAPVTPVTKGKRKHESPTPSPSPASTVKASKKVALSPEEAKRRRQANPAKRLRPIARLDSDDEDVVVVCATQSAPSAEENATSEDEVDQLWPDTLRPARAKESLVLAMLDVEAEEAEEADDEGEENEGDLDITSAWLDDSPPPKHVDPRPFEAQDKGEARVKSNVRKRRATTPKQEALGSSRGKAARRPSVSIQAPVIAVVEGSSADIFGSPVDDPIFGGFDNPIAVDSPSEEEALATARHLQLLDETVFAGIPPLISGIVDHLRSSGIASRLHYSELRPKYTARDEPEGCMPKLLDVLAMMRNEYTMPPIVDSLLFRGFGPYINPLTADPADFHVVAKKVMFKSGPKDVLYPVFVMPVVVQQCDLLSPIRVNDRFPEERLRLTGWIFEEVFDLFATFIGSVFNQDAVYAYMTASTLQFTSRPTKADGPSLPSTPQKSAQHSLAFGKPSPRHARPTARGNTDALQPKHPHSLGPEDTIPVYDGRSKHGDFRLEDHQWQAIPQMQRLGVPPSSRGQEPDYRRAVEIPPFEPSKFCIALVAFTMGVFFPKDNPTAPHVSFNMQFAILLGSWVQRKQPHSVTAQRIDALRAAAASQARVLNMAQA